MAPRRRGGQREAVPRAAAGAARRRGTAVRARPAVAAVAGPRGEWLAARRPDWAFTAPDPDQTWASGGRAQRRALLAALRAEEPARARALLESTWAEESPDDRASFVAALVANLGPDDEPLLENALEDRRKPVRRAAAELLWALPESRLAARMAQRAAPLLKVTRRRLEVTLPEQCDADMERDGIERRPPRGTGERQFWLAQLLAAAPLSTWPRPPEELVGMRIAGRLAPPGARRLGERGGAPAQRGLGAGAPRVHPARDLLEVLPREEREARRAGRARGRARLPRPVGRPAEPCRPATAPRDRRGPPPAVDLEEVCTRLHPDTLSDVAALTDAAQAGWPPPPSTG